MFLYDKDMERVMLAKKKEVLSEIEAAKRRVLHELYCLKQSVHTDYCNVQADYNRIVAMLNDTVCAVKKEVSDYINEYRKLIADTFNEYNTTIDNKLKALEAFETEVIEEVNRQLETVNETISRAEQIIADGVTQSDLDALRTELEQAIANIDVSEELEALATELREEIANAGTQSDWNETNPESKSFILNKPFGHGEIVRTVVIDAAQYNTTGDGITDTVMHNHDGGIEVSVMLECDLSDAQKVIVNINTYDNNRNPVSAEYELTPRRKSLIVFESTKRPVAQSTIVTHSTFIEEGIVFGDTGDDVFVFDEPSTNAPVAVAYDVKAGRGYFTYDPRVFNMRDHNDSSTLKITKVTTSSVNPVDPLLLAPNSPKEGSFLTFIAGKGMWSDPLFYEYEVFEFGKVFEGTTVWNKLNYTHDVNVDELQFSEGEYYFDFEGFGALFNYNSDGTFTQSDSGSEVFNAITLADGTLVLDIASGLYPYWWMSSEPNHTIKILRQEKFVKKQTLSADLIANDPCNNSYLVYRKGKAVWSDELLLTSPSGNVFRVTVTDDGVLNAVAATNE